MLKKDIYIIEEVSNNKYMCESDTWSYDFWDAKFFDSYDQAKKVAKKLEHTKHGIYRERSVTLNAKVWDHD